MVHAGPCHQFIGVSIPTYFSAASNTNFLRFIFDIVQPSVSSTSNRPFPCGIFFNTSLTVLYSGILSTRPNHCNRPFLISSIIIWLSVQIHQLFIAAGPPGGHLILLSQIFSSLFSIPILLRCFHCFCSCSEPRIVHYYRSN